MTNVDHAFVGFAPTPEEAGPLPLPEVAVDGRPVPDARAPFPTVDLLALAQDRKWQDIDTIRAVKSVAGKGLMAVGAYETAHGAGFTGHRTNTADIAAGLGMLAAGALLDASSQADLRQWEMLPRTVYLIPLHVEPGTHDVSVLFPTGERQTWRRPPGALRRRGDLLLPHAAQRPVRPPMAPRLNGRPAGLRRREFTPARAAGANAAAVTTQTNVVQKALPPRGFFTTRVPGRNTPAVRKPFDRL